MIGSYHDEGNTVRAQLARASIMLRSTALDADGNTLCLECAKQGKATFVCALCKQVRTSDEQQFHVGDPQECLCRICYETVPAKTWDTKVEQLHTDHIYDYD